MTALTAPQPLVLSNQLSLANQLSVQSLAPGYVLDQLSVFPGIAYSLRQLTGSYTGKAANVRRSSDNTAMDIGFVNGALDTATLLTFCGAGNGFVTTWYNQGSLGSGGNATQAAAANQPQIVSGGALVTQGGVPSLLFGATAYLATGNVSFTAGSAIAVAFSTTLTTSGETYISQASSSTNYWKLRAISGTSNVGYFQDSSGTVISATGGTPSSSALQIVAGVAASAIYLNGVLEGSAAAMSLALNSPVEVGAILGAAFINGYESEVLAFSAASLGTSDRATYDLNAAAFYGIAGVTQ